jgi:hypothetical protein
MLGWHISIYRQTGGGESPAAFASPTGNRLAVWQTGLEGLDWIKELVKNGKAISLGGNGYPCRYTATAEYLIPAMSDRPPGARDTWVWEASDIITEEWAGKTIIDRVQAAACRPNEWLLVEAWDES